VATRPRQNAIALNGRYRNRILASLPRPELRRIEKDLAAAPLEFKEVLHEIGVPIRDVFFVETGVLSVLAAMSDGQAVEVLTIGPEGLLGLPVALATDRAATHAVVQIPGWALRMSTEAFLRHMRAGGQLPSLVHRFAQATFTMVAQSSACNRLHSVHERCARWLLTTRDRVGGDSFPLTHEFLAQMLGVRRASVTGVIQELKRKRLIEAQRGEISIVSPGRLARESCECYFIINDEFDRLLGGKGRSKLLEKIRRRVTKRDRARRKLTRARAPLSASG
jgi:CRP-like cAMP-binding protein